MAQQITTVLGLPGSGKQLPNSEPVLTPNGWVSNGSLKVNDFVIGSNGLPTKVLGVYPQGLKQVYEVEFQDKTKVRCGAEHLWVVSHRSHGKTKTETLSTAELIQRPLISCNKSQYWVPQYLPLEQKGFTLNNAWVIGYALGNGCFTGGQFQISCHAKDAALIKKEFDSAFNTPGKCSLSSKNGYQIRYPWRKAPIELTPYKNQITKQYLNTNVLTLDTQSRKKLLAGLLDSDGHCAKNNNLSFANTSLCLINTVIELARSLGGRALLQKPDTRKTPYCYNVSISLPFNNELKIKKYLVPSNGKLTSRIKSISKLNYQEESTCIKVEAPDCLYVTTGFKLTHNTTYCKQKADKLETLGFNATWRPEPTDDVPNFIRAGMSSEQISQMVLMRFIVRDREPSFADFIWRDSDYYTSLLIFGGEPIPSAKDIIKSTHLIYLRIYPELQKQRILKRNRTIAQQELMYCSEEWHIKAEEAFKRYPCAKKRIIEVI